MAAHLENKGVSVLDMTGVAQKGGAVTTYVRIAANPDALHTVRIAAGDANAVIGCDILVTAENAIMTRMQRGLTRAVINTQRTATVAFVKNRDLQTPWTGMEDGLRDAIGADAVHFLDASRLALALLGDAVATNMLLLGSAYQLGLVPVSAEALRRAIELNGTAVDANLRAFQWGRLAVHDLAAVEKLITPAVPAGSDRALARSLDESIARRVAELTTYQDAALARRYAQRVERVRAAEQALGPDTGTDLTEAVARNYFKLLAIKDEYEVARFYTDGEFERQLAAAFEGDYQLRYHFAPPLLAKPDPKTGVPRKRKYGPWMTPVLRFVARMRWARGRWFDPFGHTEERRLERTLIREYEALLDAVLPALDRANLSTAVALASLPDGIRGYGHVKRKSIEATRVRETGIADALRDAAGDARPRRRNRWRPSGEAPPALARGREGCGGNRTRPGRRVADMQVALRKWNRDPRLVQRPQDREPQAVLRLHADVEAFHPREQAEVERTLAETHEQRAGHRNLLHLGEIGRCLLEQAQHPGGIAAVRDPDVDLVAARAIGQRPVHDLLRREIRVGHDHFRTLGRCESSTNARRCA